MKILGFDTDRLRRKGLQAVYNRPAYYGMVQEAFTGAWQANVVYAATDQVASYYAVYSCVDLIARDISKMRIKLMQQNESQIWSEIASPAFSPVLRKPNHFQTRISFFQSWISSKLLNGNTYVLKQRDQRGIVVALYVLDPMRVVPLISESGDVFYQLKSDYLSGLTESSTVVPAREMIHDTAVTLYHPLVGVSPIYACGIGATQGMAIQNNSSKLFANMSRPSGILTAPGAISDETAARLKSAWETNYSGANMGKTAVLGDGLKYEQMTITPVDAQLIEQLKMSAEVVCAAFHVPPYKIGLREPSYANVEALNLEYYSQALQAPMESIELLLDEGLGLVDAGYGTEFDLDGLLRMDTVSRYDAHTKAVGGGWLAPNEARRKENLPAVEGGATPYLQQQNYSLSALNKRDSRDDPFKTNTPSAPTVPPQVPPTDPAVKEMLLTAFLRREFEEEESQPINLTIRNEVQPTPVHIESAQVHVAPAQVNVRNEIQPTPINVEGPHINVVPSEVVIEHRAGDVHLTAPQPQVSVTNKMEPITNINVEPTTVNVEAPNVQVEAPAVTVHNEMPEFEITDQELIRDEKGRTKGMKTTKRRKK